MRADAGTVVFLAVLLACLSFGCGAPEIEDENLSYESISFDREYDEVWEALEHIMIDKMMLPIKIKDKERGLIQSDWISLIRLRGMMRWYVKVSVERGLHETRVRVSHTAEVPTEVVGTMKDNKGDIKTGWQTSRETIREVNELISLLTNALK